MFGKTPLHKPEHRLVPWGLWLKRKISANHRPIDEATVLDSRLEGLAELQSDVMLRDSTMARDIRLDIVFRACLRDLKWMAETPEGLNSQGDSIEESHCSRETNKLAENG